MEITFTQDGLIGLAIVFATILIILLIVREIRLMRTNTRKLELELEREKLSILKQDASSGIHPSYRMTTDQITALKNIDEGNATIESEIFVKQREVEGRLKRLENSLKREKLDVMLEKIVKEEKKMG